MSRRACGSGGSTRASRSLLLRGSLPRFPRAMLLLGEARPPHGESPALDPDEPPLERRVIDREPRLVCHMSALLPVNRLRAQFPASAAIAMLALAIFPATLPGVALAAGDESALEAAQQPPPVVPDSAPVAPDPAPVAPDPAPGPPETPSPPDGASPPAVDQVRAQPAPQQADAPPASAPVPQPTSAPKPARRNTRESEARPARASHRSRGARERTARTARPTSGLGVEAVVPQLTGMESDDRSGQLMAAGLALLAVVMLSGAFLGVVTPLVRARELQRP